MSDIEKAPDLDSADLYLLKKSGALERVRELLPTGWSAKVGDDGFICISDGRINGEASLEQTFDDGVSGYAADTLAENTRIAIAEIQATPRIETVTLDDCLLAIAEYRVLNTQVGRDRGLADAMLMNRTLCSDDVANEALEFYGRSDLWDYGVSARTGWLTVTGFARLHEIAPEIAACYKAAMSDHADMIDPEDAVSPKEPPANFGDA